MSFFVVVFLWLLLHAWSDQIRHDYICPKRDLVAPAAQKKPHLVPLQDKTRQACVSFKPTGGKAAAGLSDTASPVRDSDEQLLFFWLCGRRICQMGAIVSFQTRAYTFP